MIARREFIIRKRYWRGILIAGCLMFVLQSSVGAQFEQRVKVTIEDFTFITQQIPFQLSMPTVIEIHNKDKVRHDFGSPIFQGIQTRVENNGVTIYGNDIGGVFLGPGKEAIIRFSIERPGRYEFRCSIHPEMKGEIWLMDIGAV